MVPKWILEMGNRFRLSQVPKSRSIQIVLTGVSVVVVVVVGKWIVGRQDCNQDGVIDCKDFARLHVLGGFGCTAPGFESTAFFQQYQRCRQTIERLSG